MVPACGSCISWGEPVETAQAGTGWSRWGWCQGCPPAVPWSPAEALAVFAVNPPSLLMVMQGKLCAGGFGAPVNYCRQ